MVAIKTSVSMVALLSSRAAGFSSVPDGRQPFSNPSEGFGGSCTPASPRTFPGCTKKGGDVDLFGTAEGELVCAAGCTYSGKGEAMRKTCETLDTIKPGPCARPPTSCRDKLYAVESTYSFRVLSSQGFVIEPATKPMLLNVGARPGKKGGSSCPRGKCCTEMANPTEERCNLAVRVMKPRGKPAKGIHICRWDHEEETCKSKYVAYDEAKAAADSPCAQVAALAQNAAREPWKSWLVA